MLDESNYIIQHLRTYGIDLKDSIQRLARFGKKTSFGGRVNPIIHKFDTEFISLQEFIPYRELQEDELRRQIQEKVNKSIEASKLKIERRYSKQIAQIQNVFHQLTSQIDASSVLFSKNVLDLQKSLDFDLQKQKACYDIQYFYFRHIHREKMEQLEKQIEILKKDHELNLQDMKKRIEEKTVEEIAFLNSKIPEIQNSLEQAKMDIEKNKQLYEERLEALQSQHDDKMKALSYDYNLLLNDLTIKKEQLLQNIEGLKGRITAADNRLKLNEENFQNRLNFLKSSLDMEHGLKMKQKQSQMKDAEDQIAHLSESMKNIDEIVKKSYLKTKEDIENEIDREIKERDSKVTTLVREKVLEDEKLIDERKRCYENLKAEIASLKERIETERHSVQHQLEEKLSKVKEKNKKEMELLVTEKEKTQKYIDQVFAEWDSLKIATKTISEHKLKTLKTELADLKKKHASDIIEFQATHQPVPDLTDYNSQLTEELFDYQKQLILQEEKYADEQKILVNTHLDEDKARGVLSLRKANSEETQRLQDTLNAVKIEFGKAKQQYLIDEAQINEEHESEKAKIYQNYHLLIVKEQDELDSETNNMNMKIQSVNTSIQQLEDQIEQLQLQLKESIDALNPENFLKEEQTEEELRQEFQVKIEDIQQQITENKKIVTELSQKNEQLIKDEEEQKMRYIAFQKKLNDKKAELVETIDKEKQEIDMKYRILVDEQNKTISRMKDDWSVEQQHKQKILDERKSEIEKLSNDSKQKLSKIENDKEHNVQTKTQLLKQEYDQKIKRLKEQYSLEENELENEIENDKQNYLKQERFAQQDNQLKIKKLKEEFDKRKRDAERRLEEEKALIDKIKAELIQDLDWKCPYCDKLENKIQDLKKQILSLVSHTHEIETLDTNREFIASHFNSAQMRTKNIPKITLPRSRF